METLGSRLRQLRIHAKETQQDVAKILCINRVTYTQYEIDKRTPQPDMLKRLADHFSVSIDYLLGQENKNSQQNIPKDLAKFLENTEVMFDGEVHHLDEEDKQKLKNALEYVFWQAKEKNKRKPKK
ncbi:helix-turn-helix domain-containing protein [Phascolarctobacterium faecium]|uniref:helix-turn-helix domain-containing protein n=1 Tax=Phascolarctobacterium faecium TaxID=33025 RepID=UPI003AB3C5D7